MRLIRSVIKNNTTQNQSKKIIIITTGLLINQTSLATATDSFSETLSNTVNDQQQWQQLLNQASVKQTIDHPAQNNLNSEELVTNEANIADESMYISQPNQNKITADIYLLRQKGSGAAGDVDSVNKIYFADTDQQPFKNIKATLEKIYQDTLADFETAKPIIRTTIKDASEAVGYYDVKFRLQQLKGRKSQEKIKVVIESVGEPAIIENRIVDIRGEGSDLKVFQNIEKELKPTLGEPLNHLEYQASKAVIDVTSNQMGFFDGKWLNKTADVILPDNTVDIDLIYDTGGRYQFGEVVFFTIDDKTGKLTTDTKKMPVKKDIMDQLISFKKGDGYDANKVSKLSNDLANTRFFNRVDIEEILPIIDDENYELQFEKTANPDNQDSEESPQSEIVTNDLATISNPDNSQDKDSIELRSIVLANGMESLLSANNDNENPTNIDKKSISSDTYGTYTNSNTSNTYENFDGTANSIFDNLVSDTLNEAINQKVIADNKTEEQLATIKFTIDDSNNDKYRLVEQKVDNLLLLPDDKVLNEQQLKQTTILGEIADTVSTVVQDILPEDSAPDIEGQRPELTDKKTPHQVKQTKKVPIYIFVVAHKPYNAQLGFGFGTDSGFRTTARVDNNLINREGYQAGVAASWSNLEKKLSVHASKPWKHPLDDRIHAGISYKESIINQVGTNDWTTLSTLASISRNKHQDTGWNRNISLRYLYDNLDLGADIDANPEKLPAEFSSANPKQQALLFGYSINKTSVDNLANPSSGYKQNYSLELASDALLSDTNMAVAKIKLSGIHSFGDEKKHQLIVKANTGYLWADNFDDVPYTLRFFTGGDQSIRGYDHNSLSPITNGYLTGGQILATGSLEYNYAFTKGLRAAVFSDFGNAYDLKFETPTKLGMGMGLRWASPVGSVRMDVGAGVLEKDIPIRLHLLIGSPL